MAGNPKRMPAGRKNSRIVMIVLLAGNSLTSTKTRAAFESSIAAYWINPLRIPAQYGHSWWVRWLPYGFPKAGIRGCVRILPGRLIETRPDTACSNMRLLVLVKDRPQTRTTPSTSKNATKLIVSGQLIAIWYSALLWAWGAHFQISVR